MSATHKHTGSVSQNQKAHLATAYNELGKELSSTKVKVVGNYTLGRVIGEGAYGKVRMGTHRLTSTRVAIKQIPKSMSSSLTREIHHHRQLHHPHVTQMYEVIATETSIWIVTELCSGGELFDYLVEKGRLSEIEARIIFGQLCLAVAYLHEKGIVHRDLKLENVLLDERCRVKLGDFGFTREFERGSLMETFCGTTGYASPEMLEGKKYQGPEVDVWSLGIILYCLLTGTLPFDDDDERIMREKIIRGEFEDPEWLSLDVRDLIQNILVKDTAKRLTIPQILSHPWFTPRPMNFRTETPPPPPVSAPSPEPRSSAEASSSSVTTDSNSGEVWTSTPTTPDDDPFDPNYIPDKNRVFHSNASETTLRKASSDLARLNERPETVMEDDEEDTTPATPYYKVSRAPPMHTVRTPARTKRRSVSSTLSDPNSPTTDKTPTTLPVPQKEDNIDYTSLLTTAAPIIFSTTLERQVLNSLSTLGFDLGQIVYSVMNDACDAASALWWMLLRKAEKRSLEDGSPSPPEVSASVDAQVAEHVEKEKKGGKSKSRPNYKKHHAVTVGVQTEPALLFAPTLAFVPPTPTTAVGVRPSTPPRHSSSTSPMLTPSSSVIVGSGPSTPVGSLNSKGRQKRSGSVSIMQRATTALEAAGLVRKKSSEAMQQKAQEKEKEKERDKSKETERKSSKGDEPRSSHGSVASSSRLVKSPPLRPSTPPRSEGHEPMSTGSPWVLTDHVQTTRSAPTPANSPSVGTPSRSVPTMTKGSGQQKNRANFLHTFRFWLNQEDRKGKRKENNATSPGGSRYNRTNVSPGQSYATGSMKRRTSSGASRGGRPRTQRPSMSSRRSSSVNSRRSSIASVQMIVLDSPQQIPGRRSMGSHTPNSERGDYPSRPSSIRSFSNQRHRKSPSASSTGSQHFRAASPLQQYHRRAGSGSSTRVVRQVQPSRSHQRSNSAASSIHSPVSSRPTSYIEFSESELPRTASPYKSRRSNSLGTFVAQKRQAPFTSPLQGYGSIGRSSWKKSWGLEPPGWQTRTTHLPVEVIAISPATDGTSVRDVFAGRGSLSMGDESDWVDEDDDIPYAVGLGQATLMSSSSKSREREREPALTLSPPPRGHRSSGKRAKGSSSSSSSGGLSSRQKPGQSPIERSSPLPSETLYDGGDSRGTRRQLPNTRSGPAAIQEEDEEEEEEE